MNLANSLTAMRIALVPIFGALWWSGRPGAALGIFAAGALTDILDGLAARALDQRTPLGAVLDPAADKLTLLVAFLVAASTHAVPWWLAGLVIGRDLVLSLGAATIFAAVPHPHWHPSRLGKYTTFAQLCTIGLALVARAFDLRWLQDWLSAGVLVTVVLTVVSGMQYVASGIQALRKRHA